MELKKCDLGCDQIAIVECKINKFSVCRYHLPTLTKLHQDFDFRTLVIYLD